GDAYLFYLAGCAAIMPSDKHTKIKERQLLANRIERNGIPMPLCSNCIRSERSCVVAPRHRRCSECTRRNSKCDAYGPSTAKWEKLQQEAYARRMRLRKQQKALKLRSAEMLRRGLKSLDELEEAEERDRYEAESHAHLLSPTTTNPKIVGSAHDPY
ncbi:hypothetical protein V499_01663, partial [Pseudogymnoascus sp. VKM F-103]